MKITARTWRVALVSAVGCLALAGTLALAQGTQDGKSTKPAKPTLPGKDAPPMELPPGMSPEDMQACIEAATPGPMHAFLAKNVGTWEGRSQMWMAPGMEPTVSDCVSKVSPMMDGRFFRTEVAGEVPGMGPFTGFVIVGFDNVTQKFVGVWMDNFGTGMANGIGELSSDGQTINWTYTYNCPITKKPVTWRQVESFPDANRMTIEMFMTDPKTGAEYRNMRIENKRAGAPR